MDGESQWKQDTTDRFIGNPQHLPGASRNAAARALLAAARAFVTTHQGLHQAAAHAHVP